MRRRVGNPAGAALAMRPASRAVAHAVRAIGLQERVESNDSVGKFARARRLQCSAVAGEFAHPTAPRTWPRLAAAAASAARPVQILPARRAHDIAAVVDQDAAQERALDLAGELDAFERRVALVRLR